MFRPGESPVPGYPLLKPLGRGQYGEVWEVEGPGGTRLAIKFIPVQDAKGQVELRSIQAVKRIRHANLIPIHAVWLLDIDGHVMESDSLERATAGARGQKIDQTLVSGQAEGEPRELERIAYLAICMTLADGNLQGRLEQAVEEGHRGIPREELIDYIQQAAAGLDFLNSPRHAVDGKTVGIQHRDIKPANLLLLGDTVVVGDFGVATTLKDFEATATTALGSLAFMAPESLSRKPSQASDQYSLAISWYQLRTNRLPYDADVSLSELIEIHREGLLSFDGVEPLEREVLNRATAADPRTRYGSCREFAQALREAGPSSRPGPRRTWLMPAVAALLIALLVPGVLLVDPFGWFVPDPDPVVPEVPPVTTVQPKRYVLLMEPPQVTGELQIRYPTGPVDARTQPLTGSNDLELAGDELIVLNVQSENPFFKSTRLSFTVPDLEAASWKVPLPAVPREQVMEEIDKLLNSDNAAKGEELYLRAARYDSQLRNMPVPVAIEPGKAITRLAVAGGQSVLATGTRDENGDSAAVWRIENGQPQSVGGPASNNSSVIEALFLSTDAKDLFVVRQSAIEWWNTEAAAESVESFGQADSANADTGRWIRSRLSPQGHWLACADDRGNLLVRDLRQPMTANSVARGTLESSIVDLQFSADDSSLIVIREEFPAIRIRLPDLLPGDLLANTNEIQADAAGEFVTQSAVAGETLAVALEQSVLVANLAETGAELSMEPLFRDDNNSISLLRASPDGRWMLVGTDGDPSILLYDMSTRQPALNLGSHELHSVRDANFSPDGRWAAISSHDGTLSLIDFGNGQPQLAPFHKFSDGYLQFAMFTGDSRYLVGAFVPAGAGAAASRLLVWDLLRCRLAMTASRAQ